MTGVLVRRLVEGDHTEGNPPRTPLPRAKHFRKYDFIRSSRTLTAATNTYFSASVLLQPFVHAEPAPRMGHLPIPQFACAHHFWLIAQGTGWVARVEPHCTPIPANGVRMGIPPPPVTIVQEEGSWWVNPPSWGSKLPASGGAFQED